MHRFFTSRIFPPRAVRISARITISTPRRYEKNLKKFPDLQTWLPELADRFEKRIHWRVFHRREIEAVVKAFTEEKGTKLGVIMNGARTLLTGVAVGPSMLSVFEVIGLERTLMRLRSQVVWNQSAEARTQ